MCTPTVYTYMCVFKFCLTGSDHIRFNHLNHFLVHNQILLQAALNSKEAEADLNQTSSLEWRGVVEWARTRTSSSWRSSLEV